MLTLIVADFILFAIFFWGMVNCDIEIEYRYNPKKYQSQYDTHQTWKYVSGGLFVLNTLYLTTQF